MVVVLHMFETFRSKFQLCHKQKLSLQNKTLVERRQFQMNFQMRYILFDFFLISLKANIPKMLKCTLFGCWCSFWPEVFSRTQNTVFISRAS